MYVGVRQYWEKIRSRHSHSCTLNGAANSLYASGSEVVASFGFWESVDFSSSKWS